ncbi:MurR/RpiR family transcriptional regulator [Tepidimicrobium xylanilyticum]|uniref:Transcriptional regulator, RpiR family n=1 Tax=Tepidimicrobium xylanilyticum TaxID=1123352 RepID=A0A1H2TS02_9FIRM|nr:MurR/RpiR family transcriptional regulator [Tepidimicrobium xylanilyticum]SDW46622.1 transcriptional regulator, RpiR family [Tepidimicrobium xylanilyticum]
MIIPISNDILEKLTETEKSVVNYINSNTDKLPSMSIVDVAEETFTSPATVSRTIKKCGLDGFTELRYILSKKDILNKDSKQVNAILGKSLMEATYTLEQISVSNILQVVELIKKSNRIYILARGLTELVAAEFSLKLLLMGYNAFEISDPNIMIEISKGLKKDELIIIFSLNGKTPELITSAKNAFELGCNVVSCCGSSNTELKEFSHIFLNGYKHSHISIKKFEVTSRLPLYIISRVIIDYLAIS